MRITKEQRRPFNNHIILEQDEIDYLRETLRIIQETDRAHERLGESNSQRVTFKDEERRIRKELGE